MWDTEISGILDILNSEFPAVQEMTGPQAREAVAARRAPITNSDDVVRTEDRDIGSHGQLGIRLYFPSTSDELLPVLVFFHGGGFVFCDIESHDGFCREMSRYTRSIVVSVDYRLAPENKAPAAAEDAHTAVDWVARNAASFGGDPTRLLTVGDSAGGNLATVACLLAAERGGPEIHGQVLLYPVIVPSCDTESYRTYATGYYNTAAAMRWYWQQYLDGGVVPEPEHHVAPMTAPDLGVLPRTVVVTAGLDPLSDEGGAYVNALRDAGVPVLHRHFGGLFHGFLTFATLRAAQQARRMLWRDISRIAGADSAVATSGVHA